MNGSSGLLPYLFQIPLLQIFPQNKFYLRILLYTQMEFRVMWKNRSKNSTFIAAERIGPDLIAEYYYQRDEPQQGGQYNNTSSNHPTF